MILCTQLLLQLLWSHPILLYFVVHTEPKRHDQHRQSLVCSYTGYYAAGCVTPCLVTHYSHNHLTVFCDLSHSSFSVPSDQNG